MVFSVLCASQDAHGGVSQAQAARTDFLRPVGQASGFGIAVEQVLVDGVDLRRDGQAAKESLGFRRSAESGLDLGFGFFGVVRQTGRIGRTAEVSKIRLLQESFASHGDSLRVDD